jgi:hypothetical protein
LLAIGFVRRRCRISSRRPRRSRSERLKPMTDFIYLAVVALFFVAAEIYAHWCEKL